MKFLRLEKGFRLLNFEIFAVVIYDSAPRISKREQIVKTLTRFYTFKCSKVHRIKFNWTYCAQNTNNATKKR